MKLRTEIQPLSSPVKITFDRPVFLAGSCFTSNIGAKLREHGFDVCVNPTGNVYNPSSLADMLERLASGNTYAPDDLFEHDGLWHSFDHHTSFSRPDRDEALVAINEALLQGREALTRASHVIFTLGTAMVFRLRDSGRTVSNCHKLHPDRFSRSRLSVSDCVSELYRCMDAVRSLNPGAMVIFTVSPIRHVADGLHGNQLSKATLLLAIEECISAINSSLSDYANSPAVSYFPAYEMLIDDLRDYRFYAADMVHPSEVAVGYVWERFAEAFITPATLEEGRRRRKQLLREAHRPLSASTNHVS